MIAEIVFEFPAAWLCGIPLAALLAFAAWRQRQHGLSLPRTSALLALRAVPLLILLFLAARPVRLARPRDKAGARPVVVLLDRSESMSLKELDTTRYQRALDFLARRLLPALQSANLPVQGMLFDEGAENASGTQMISTKPEGKRTNLGGAIVQALADGHQPPLAVIALTDGLANDDSDNVRATGALADSRVPFIGVGFGSDQGAQTLSLRRLDGPTTVAPQTRFNISAELEMLNADQSIGCDVVLFRDGQALQRKSVALDKGSRNWVQNFQVTEPEQGIHEYVVQLLAPDLPNLKCPNSQAVTSVRISKQKELRVLYVQGTLTWDYKFIGLALRNDPNIKLTGLTRTSQQSVFRQNVEGTGELMSGFPTSMDELAPFRVVVLSNLRSEDLTPAQQDLLTRYCAELSGGVLILGGPSSFSSWKNSRLEQMLPVVLSENSANRQPERPFHVQLTAEATRNPVFQLAEGPSVQELWNGLPAFNEFASVDSPKLGAQIWMVLPNGAGPQDNQILLASQRYGAGISAVFCLQNFWRWRLSKDGDPAQFDRFWRQFFRWLGDAGEQDISIQFADQQLRPNQDLRILLERQMTPQAGSDTNRQFLVQVQDSHEKVLREEAMDLQPAQQTEFKFRPDAPDLYTVKVLSSAQSILASRSIEVRDTDPELTQTARNMETLRQWAAVSDGLAFKVEECPMADDLMARIKNKVQQVQRGQETRKVAGINGWILTVVLGCLSGEWLLRKRWMMI